MVNQRVSFVPARHYNKQVILLCSPKLPITSCKKNVYLRLKKQDTSCKKFKKKKVRSWGTMGTDMQVPCEPLVPQDSIITTKSQVKFAG